MSRGFPISILSCRGLVTPTLASRARTWLQFWLKKKQEKKRKCDNGKEFRICGTRQSQAARKMPQLPCQIARPKALNTFTGYVGWSTFSLSQSQGYFSTLSIEVSLTFSIHPSQLLSVVIKICYLEFSNFQVSAIS